MKRRKKTNWLLELYEDNKLYIWVVIGVLVISGVTIGLTVGSSNSSKIVPNDIDITLVDEDEGITETNTIPIKEEIEETIVNKDNKSDEKQRLKETNLKKNNNIEDKKNINEEQEEVKQEKNKKLEFIEPLEGNIVKNFSEDTLIYSNTLEEWISHIGIDIEAEKAMPVKAIEGGEVIGIKQDPRYGYTIIIDHGQGYKSIYCNLSTLDMVFEGKIVEKGQVISGVGDTALFEIKDNPHLHFEIMYNDEYVNPLEIIK